MTTSSQDSEMLLKVSNSLKDGPYACTSLAKLSGGTANFVYRGVLKTTLEDGSKTVVIKHTEGYVAQSPGFKIARSRCDYEQTILTALSGLSASPHDNITVLTPTLHHFSPTTNTQIYSDLPKCLDLKTYILKHASSLTLPQFQRLGHALGLWTKRFHSWSQAPEQKILVQGMKGNIAMRDLKYLINYERLVQTVDSFPNILRESKEVFERVREKRREEMEGEGQVLIHGDFWSGNVLLPSHALSPSSPTQIFIADWEMSQLASPAYDLGQMFAELYELKHFKDIDAGIWLIEAFMDGYGNVSEELAFKTVIHAGVHLICWGSRVEGWGSESQVEGVVERGREWVVGGWKGRRDVFEGGPMACLFT